MSSPNYGPSNDLDKYLNKENRDLISSSVYNDSNISDKNDKLRQWTEQAKNAYDSVVHRLKQKEGLLKIKSQEYENLASNFKENEILLKQQKQMISQLEDKVAALSIELTQMRQLSSEREREFQYSITNLQALASTYLDEVRSVRENAASVTASHSICIKCQSDQCDLGPLSVENNDRVTNLVICPNNISDNSHIPFSDTLPHERMRMDSLSGVNCITGGMISPRGVELGDDITTTSVPLSLGTIPHTRNYESIKPYSTALTIANNNIDLSSTQQHLHQYPSFNSYNIRNPLPPGSQSLSSRTVQLLPLHPIISNHQQQHQPQLSSDYSGVFGGNFNLQQQEQIEKDPSLYHVGVYGAMNNAAGK